MDPSSRIPPDKMNSVQRVVQEVRKDFLKDKVGVESMPGTYANLLEFFRLHNVALAVRNHNDGKKPI